MYPLYLSKAAVSGSLMGYWCLTHAVMHDSYPVLSAIRCAATELGTSARNNAVCSIFLRRTSIGLGDSVEINLPAWWNATPQGTILASNTSRPAGVRFNCSNTSRSDSWSSVSVVNSDAFTNPGRPQHLILIKLWNNYKKICTTNTHHKWSTSYS